MGWIQIGTPKIRSWIWIRNKSFRIRNTAFICFIKLNHYR